MSSSLSVSAVLTSAQEQLSRLSSPPLYNSLKKDTPDIYFVGNTISPTYLSEVVSLC